MSLLRLTAVSRHFGGVRALSGISLDVTAGQVLGLIGPNGAGKTTLFNAITGIYSVTTGQVLFRDRDISGWRPAAIARAGIARTFQNVHIFGGMTALENVLMGQSRYAPAGLRNLVPVVADRREAALRRQAADTLARLDLMHYAEDQARTLPYAMQRKVEMARALAGEPSLLLLDEPAAGLNERESQSLCADIRRIRDQGVTVMLIEHDMSVVMDVCDRLAVLNFGEKIAEGSAAEIRDNPLVIEAYLGSEEDRELTAPGSGPVG